MCMTIFPLLNNKIQRPPSPSRATNGSTDGDGLHESRLGLQAAEAEMKRLMEELRNANGYVSFSVLLRHTL